MSLKQFDVIFLEEAIDFIDRLDLKTRKKIYYRLDRARSGLDNRLLKKLTREIWEFRTKYNGIQYRFLAFWERENKSNTLVVITHGMVKKVDKLPHKEIKKAMNIRNRYFEQGYGK